MMITTSCTFPIKCLTFQTSLSKYWRFVTNLEGRRKVPFSVCMTRAGQSMHYETIRTRALPMLYPKRQSLKGVGCWSWLVGHTQIVIWETRVCVPKPYQVVFVPERNQTSLSAYHHLFQWISGRKGCVSNIESAPVVWNVLYKLHLTLQTDAVGCDKAASGFDDLGWEQGWKPDLL